MGLIRSANCAFTLRSVRTCTEKCLHNLRNLDLNLLHKRATVAYFSNLYIVTNLTPKGTFEIRLFKRIVLAQLPVIFIRGVVQTS